MAKFVLEQSTNTHAIEADHIVATEINEICTNLQFAICTKLQISGDGIVTHGEHGVIKTEAEIVLKYNQMELNPVTKALNAAFD